MFFKMASSRVQPGPEYSPKGLRSFSWWHCRSGTPSGTLPILRVASSKLEDPTQGHLDIYPRTLSLPAHLWPNKHPRAGAGGRESAGSGGSRVFVLISAWLHPYPSRDHGWLKALVPSSARWHNNPFSAKMLQSLETRSVEAPAQPLAMQGGAMVWEARSSETKGESESGPCWAGGWEGRAAQPPRLWSAPPGHRARSPGGASPETAVLVECSVSLCAPLPLTGAGRQRGTAQC